MAACHFRWVRLGRKLRRVAVESVAHLRIENPVLEEVVVVVRWLRLLPVQWVEGVGDDVRRERNEESADRLEKAGTGRRVQESPVIEVHSEQTAPFLDRHFDFGLHELGFRPGVVTDQKDERVGLEDFVSAGRFDVIRVLGIDRLIELEVGEIEVDILSSLSKRTSCGSPRCQCC